MYESQADNIFFEIQKDLLKTWHYEDPVDNDEIARNELVAQYQGGKENPFILDSTLIRRAYFSENISSVENPSNFSAIVPGENQIDLTWLKNGENDDVLIVWNTNGNFTNPENETTYLDGSTALGGTIIGRNSNLSYEHENLETGVNYYYKAFSVQGPAGFEEYSTGVTTQANTSIIFEAQPGDIIITEIMQNPSAVYDQEGEWFEIYNKTDHSITLEGCYIKDDDNDAHQISTTGDFLIPAETYLVFGRNGNISTNGSVAIDYEYSGLDLANATDEIVLYLPDGITEINRIEYDGGPQWPDPNGASMHFSGNITQENNDPVLWAESDIVWEGSSGDLGTPGFANTVSSISRKLDFLPTKLNLKNYPNPFNPETAISYQLKKSSQIELSIYNLLGQKIIHLVSEYQQTGPHGITWNGNDMYGKLVVSGIYVIQLQTEFGFERRKITLIR